LPLDLDSDNVWAIRTLICNFERPKFFYEFSKRADVTIS